MGQTATIIEERFSDDWLATLYVNGGRSDDLKASELGRLLRERTGLKRKEISRIRVRDEHSLVDVPEERVQDVIDSMAGAVLRERELSVELAENEGNARRS